MPRTTFFAIEVTTMLLKGGMSPFDARGFAAGLAVDTRCIPELRWLSSIGARREEHECAYVGRHFPFPPTDRARSGSSRTVACIVGWLRIPGAVAPVHHLTA